MSRKTNEMCFICLAAFFCLVGIGFGQEQHRLQALMGRLSILEDPAITEELGVSREQLDRIAAILEPFRKQTMILQKSLAEKGSPDFDQNVKLADELAAKLENELNDVLVDFQLKRLKQLAKQDSMLIHLPSSGLVDVKTAQSFGIDSKATWLKIRTIDRETEQEIVKLHQRFEREMIELLESRDAKLKALMSDQLKSKYDREFGKPFSRPLEVFMIYRFWTNRQFQIDNHMRHWDDKAKKLSDEFQKLKKMSIEEIEKMPKGGRKVVPD